MAAQGYSFPTLPGAQACQQAVDAAVGYPRPGINVGGGIHAPPAQTTTTTYAAPIPLAGAFYYPADATTAPVLAPLAATLTLGPAGPIPYPIAPGLPDQPAAVVVAQASTPPASTVGRNLLVAAAVVATAAGIAWAALSGGGATSNPPTDAGITDSAE